jgi:hypothetical protein
VPLGSVQPTQILTISHFANNGSLIKMVFHQRRCAAAATLAALFVVAAVAGVLSLYSHDQGGQATSTAVGRVLGETLVRRREQSSVTCLLSQVEVLLSIEPMTSKQIFQCAPIINGAEIGAKHDVVLDDAAVQEYLLRSKDRQDVTVSITNAYIDDAEAIVVLAADSTITFLQSPFRKRKRKLLTAIGSYSMLVVRVELVNAAPTFSASELYDYTFQKDVSMKNQYARCSYGKLQITPAPLGVITIPIYSLGTGNSQQSVVNAAQAAALNYINSVYRTGYTDIHQHTDMIMFVLPPMGNWLAYATVGGSTSVYNDKWGGYVASNMHETGYV